ncbi:DUF305 domain-containing protein [uncultured Brevundimonas sp.]|uniref:DUF305 domain-containing protein n=1 Tax=uncultured Brevundimonas sp. TaxID=213418 RepID=UPI0030EDB4BE|tara:strand:+ start:1010 stop:1465 length:456 start_codon:yes stop_codon:yes gene_type:complete
MNAQPNANSAPSPTRPLRRSALRLALLGALGLATPLGASTPSDAFMAENDAAMIRMHAAMTIRPSGDIDRDFVAMMIPHHQGGIDMAVAVLRHSRNAQVRRLAQEIIVEQQQEIAALRLAVGEPLPPSAPAPTNPERVVPGGESFHPHHGG